MKNRNVIELLDIAKMQVSTKTAGIFIDYALAALESEPCKTCKDSKRICNNCGNVWAEKQLCNCNSMAIPCPDCQKSEPVEPSEFTEEAINYIYGSPCMSKTSCKGYAERLERACGFIDCQAATIKSFRRYRNQTIKLQNEIADLKKLTVDEPEHRPNPIE